MLYLSRKSRRRILKLVIALHLIGNGNRDACMRQVVPVGDEVQRLAVFIKPERVQRILTTEDPPFIIEYWSSTTLPPMRNPKDHIQQHVQRESQGASLKEHGHSSRVTSRKGFVALVVTWRYIGVVK